MRLRIHGDKRTLGRTAGAEAAEALRAAIEVRGHAVVVLATGVSQFETLDALIVGDVDFSRVTGFHLDEYVGLPGTHPASFRRYLRERVLERSPPFGDFVMVEGDAPDLDAELARLNGRLRNMAVDLCLAGIGENCHLAFNDPPADFEVEEPFILVQLDEACRRQQLGEGWFASLETVPTRAISMSIRQIMKARRIILSAPDARKAAAVRAAVEGPVTPEAPASILQRHPDATLHLDAGSAAMLSERTLARS